MVSIGQDQSLYRFFAGEELLYVGITLNLPGRWKSHSRGKPWWSEVTNCTVEHFPDRASVARAEKTAIETEHPRYNIQFNSSPGKPGVVPAVAGWTYSSKKSAVTRTTSLQLYPELDSSSMIDDYWDCDGQIQLNEYVRYLKRRHPQWLERDAVPISWMVMDACEFAPFQPGMKECNFLTYFTWPVDATTGEPVNWYQLPVRNDRFPTFAAALGWTPSALLPFCPLSSILRLSS